VNFKLSKNQLNKKQQNEKSIIKCIYCLATQFAYAGDHVIVIKD